MRVSTFNVENLFSRPTILNRPDHAWVSARLDEVAELTRLLQKKTYAADATRIRDLYVALKDFITINIRSSDVGHMIIKADGTLIARGADDWVGFVDLKRERFDAEQVRFTGKVIREVKADVQCLIEVESRKTLELFNTDILDSLFRDRLVIEGNDPRGIDIALATKKTAPLLLARTNAFARDAVGEVFSRDCLEAELALPGDKRLHVLVNHFKAKDRKPEISNEKRRRQAAEVSRILTTRYDLKRDLVIVAGDMNDEPLSAPLKPLRDTPDLHDVFDLVNRPVADRWTYYYGRDKAFNAIDQMYVSTALKAHLRDAGIERRGMSGLSKLTNGAETEFEGITSWRLAASDHGAVWADFDFG
jgi:endonuclease/exonuclease/phosphatase family metal-dependent hydrolase